ncbi:MAG: hypothetical protein A3K09_00240 [Nitrospinae bacterium RIFCSPLOWO2_12_FULL_47_7]|nr:MAG: hypothetical protein A3K09_00240 [Nitrospinae bacterium RIFCSPLOWO2_12_FULL_47_7]
MLRKMRQLKGQLHVASAEFHLLLFSFILFMVGAMAYVWPNIKMINLAYEFQAIQKEHRDLLKENSMLKLERGSLQSLSRIQSLGKTRLGFNEPDKNQMVTIFLK